MLIKGSMLQPGGKIFVFTGILPVCKNDDGLASVLGHGGSRAGLWHKEQI